MLSKISITVDEDSKSCIKIDYKESDDVRDLLVKMFLESRWSRRTNASIILSV